MKKIVALFLSLSMMFALAACGNGNNGNDTADIQSSSESAETVTQTPTEAPTEALTEADTEKLSEDPETAEGKTLVVYYSATGNTEEAAGYIAAATGADTLELVPVEPYTDEDLNYNDDSSRVVYEHDNPDARAEELVESTVSDWESYDTVFIGYPKMEYLNKSVYSA